MKTDVDSAPKQNSRWTIIKRKTRKVFYVFLIMFVIIISIFIYRKYFHTYSDGYHTGLLQKFSHKGNIFKTYEGEMILSNSYGNSDLILVFDRFNFSVTDKKLAQQFDTIQGQKVRVHYKQKNGVLFWHGDSKYLVDSVKRIK